MNIKKIDLISIFNNLQNEVLYHLFHITESTVTKASMSIKIKMIVTRTDTETDTVITAVDTIKSPKRNWRYRKLMNYEQNLEWHLFGDETVVAYISCSCSPHYG